MQQTPKAVQLHIGLFGKRNAGKSTLMNALLDQEMSIVSPVAGTTTDIVHKSKEWHPLGPVVLVDTPGLDDEGELGLLRVKKAKHTLDEMDLIVWVTAQVLDTEEEQFIDELIASKRPVLVVYNQKEKSLPEGIKPSWQIVNAQTRENLDLLKQAITEKLKGLEERLCIGDRVKAGDVVLLVAPQDIQAPKGRLILPQVQVLRELLDAKAIPMTTTADTLKEALAALKEPPSLIITDSQVFNKVYEVCPKEVPLTSFSILMARQKGDLQAYVEGTKAIAALKEGDKVLITESCTHNPLHGDIARMQLPAALSKQLGFEIQCDNRAGRDFPEDLSPYALIIQCGGCMQTPKQIEVRIHEAQKAQIPITNFGVVLAYLGGILEKVWIPER